MSKIRIRREKPRELTSRRTLADASGDGHVIDGNVSCEVCSPYPLEGNLSTRKNAGHHNPRPNKRLKGSIYQSIHLPQ